MHTPYTRALAAGIAVLALASAPRAAAQKPAAGRVVLLDRIIAVVNDEVITRRDLDDRIKVVLSQLKQQGTPLPPSDVLEKQVLERVIYNQGQLQYAKETGLRVEDSILEKAVTRIAEDNKVSVAAMRQTLEKEGVSFNKFREELRDEIIMVRLREREV